MEFAPTFRPRKEISHIIFDFDGTLSLVRGGWTEVMLQVCLDHLPPRTDDDATHVREMLLDDILSLNGRPTIFQMIRFTERVAERGVTPRDAEWYKNEYLARLEQLISTRKKRLANKESRSLLEVRGAHAFLTHLQNEGYRLIMASGTDERFVREESALLGLDKFFGNHIYAAPTGREKEFSKRAVIAHVMQSQNIAAERLLGFGDGHVETENITEFGGLAVAVASDEQNPGSAKIDPWKRQRLLGVGAQIVIPDYADGPALMDVILGKA